LKGNKLTDQERMAAIDAQVAHIWMVRAFLKHCDEAVEDEELASVHRDLYDFMLALGPSLDAADAQGYLRMARKKISKLKQAAALFAEIQPEVSSHTNFQMAARSLLLAVKQVESLLAKTAQQEL
jgi:cob(I)alamin adenosyltransferase